MSQIGKKTLKPLKRSLWNSSEDLRCALGPYGFLRAALRGLSVAWQGTFLACTGNSTRHSGGRQREVPPRKYVYTASRSACSNNPTTSADVMFCANKLRAHGNSAGTSGHPRALAFKAGKRFATAVAKSSGYVLGWKQASVCMHEPSYRTTRWIELHTTLWTHTT